MGRIRILSPGLINRIAAGECVERPASVVKELVENALDAGASRIDVHVLEGGRDLIQVSDDGVGMDADDLRLSVAPHATSKIAADDDLFDIHTMGFRGEALASIGSVARLKITSRTRDSDAACTISLDGGEFSGPAPAAAPPGTSVEVRDLFYCVPARRKFLRSNPAEMGHITEQLARIALAHPGVSFSLTHQKRRVHSLLACEGYRKRIGDLFGGDLADVLLPILRENDALRIEALVAPPAESRGANKWEYVFVNGRYVRDRFVSHAVKEAYRSLIDPSRFPVAFLYLTIDPGQVDVNVHPTKIEVRWRDSNFIHGQVLAALREKFLSTNLDHALKPGQPSDQYRQRVRNAMVEFFTTGGRGSGGGQRPATFDDAQQPELALPAAPGTAGRSAEQSLNLECRPQAAPAGAQSTQRLGESAAPASAIAPHSPEADQRPQVAMHEPEIGDSQASAGSARIAPGSAESVRPRAIQIHNTFLVVETHDGLMIIDQHALHERILYEELRRRIAERTLTAQRLLIPEIIRVPADRIEALETHAETLARLGIELSVAGPQSVALQAFPSFLQRLDGSRFVRDLLDLLSEPGVRPARDTLLHQLLDMMACKAAVKAGDALTNEEIDALLARRDLAERASHCPHGRPTTLHLTMHDLERQFKRR